MSCLILTTSNPSSLSPPPSLTELGEGVTELIQDAFAREGRGVDIGDKSDLGRILGRRIPGAVHTLQLVLCDISLGLGDLDLCADNETLSLGLSGDGILDSTVVSSDGLSIDMREA